MTGLSLESRLMISFLSFLVSTFACFGRDDKKLIAVVA